MPYNQKYFFEFDTLKTANKATKYYRVVFSKLEDIAYTYDLIELQAANSPFVLTYRSPEDNAFSPIKTSSAEINILYPYDPATGTPEPDEFLDNTTEALWLVQLYEMTSNGSVSSLKWQGFLINDVQFEWQDAYYYRLVATDNLAVLKDVKFSDDTEFKMIDYVPTDGISVKDFIIKLVNRTSNTLNYKFAWELFNNGNSVTLDTLYTSLYTLIDWKTFQPKNIYPVLEDVLKTLGCIIYQDNNDATWTILNVAEIGTRTDNEVPYTEYDSTGTFVDTGVIFLNSSINKFGNDLVWRDRNQIVSFLKPIGNYDIEIPYIQKNLLRNYSFQVDPFGTTPPTGWNITGFFNNSSAFGASDFFGNAYDDYFLVIDESESNTTPLGISNYIYQEIPLDNSPLISSLPSDYQFLVFLDFKTYNKKSNINANGEGFNFRLVTQLPAPLGGTFYDTEEFAVNRNNGGQWIYGASSALGRTAVIASTESPYQRISLLTKAINLTNNGNPLRIDFLPFRYDPTVSSGFGYALDEMKLSITHASYRYLDALKFTVNFNKKFTTVKAKSIFTGGFNTFDWYVFEGALGLKENTYNTLYCNALWDRHFENHDEANFNYLDAIVAKSKLSFYRNISRKFTGNIWGEQISYPKYFEIEGAVNKNASSEISNAFAVRVTDDSGTVETVLCGSNYLDEYYQKNAKFLMVEASFDYQQSTTNVNLHEDLTSVIENNFIAGFGGFQYGQGGFPGSFGSSTNAEQSPVEFT